MIDRKYVIADISKDGTNSLYWGSIADDGPESVLAYANNHVNLRWSSHGDRLKNEGTVRFVVAPVVTAPNTVDITKLRFYTVKYSTQPTVTLV